VAKTGTDPLTVTVVRHIAAAAQETGRTVSVCGEAASNPQYLNTLIQLGLTRLSVSPRFIPELRLASQWYSTEGKRWASLQAAIG
jgi:phosphoenolpyruvate-protein kinase (PTS system EI component)